MALSSAVDVLKAEVASKSAQVTERLHQMTLLSKENYSLTASVEGFQHIKSVLEREACRTAALDCELKQTKSVKKHQNRLAKLESKLQKSEKAYKKLEKRLKNPSFGAYQHWPAYYRLVTALQARQACRCSHR